MKVTLMSHNSSHFTHLISQAQQRRTYVSINSLRGLFALWLNDQCCGNSAVFPPTIWGYQPTNYYATKRIPLFQLNHCLLDSPFYIWNTRFMPVNLHNFVGFTSQLGMVYCTAIKLCNLFLYVCGMTLKGQGRNKCATSRRDGTFYKVG